MRGNSDIPFFLVIMVLLSLLGVMSVCMVIAIHNDLPVDIIEKHQQETVLDIWLPVAETIDLMTSLSEQEVDDVTNAYVDIFNTVRNRNLMPYVLGIMVVESGCNYRSTHSKSSARGIGQIIYKYHPELADKGISEKDLTSDIYKSIMATYLVLERYWIKNDFHYKKAIFAYRGRDYETYYNRVTEIACMLGSKILR